MGENELSIARILRFERRRSMSLRLSFSTSFVETIRPFESEIAGEGIDEGKRGGVAFEGDEYLDLRAGSELVVVVQPEDCEAE